MVGRNPLGWRRDEIKNQSCDTQRSIEVVFRDFIDANELEKHSYIYYYTTTTIQSAQQPTKTNRKRKKVGRRTYHNDAKQQQAEENPKEKQRER